MHPMNRVPAVFDDAFDRAFRRFLTPARWDADVTEPQIKVDVDEADNAYTVKAEIPGVNKDDIKVDVDGDVVTISAEVKREKEEKKGARVIRSERYYGAVQRSFSLGKDVDSAAASARYENGVLQLQLPKKSGGATKRLTVS